MPQDFTERWLAVQDLFARACEMAETEREACIAACPDEEVRREVRELLACDAGSGQTRLHAAVSSLAGEVVRPMDEAAPGALFGNWRVTGELGSGGMGTVYAVERADGVYRQRAAMKLIRGDSHGPDGLRRFLEERDILARLEHPNIARLLDGGETAQGRPFLVMELIEGSPLTAYCESRGLAVDARVRLFVDVCSAVQAAHARLVVHRDLKPGNILVTEDGTVKLLDFGIAKMLDPGREGQTRTGAAMLTPEYASPEQVGGQEVTTATDVYSLGVVLYELLSGAKAHHFSTSSPAELVRVVIEEEPKPVSEAAAPDRRKRLRGDLDNIVTMAMRKDPARRYASAEALKEDLERYLDGRAVRARPDTFGYRAGKFVRRNAWGVAAAALTAASLIGAVVVSRAEAQRAQRRFDEVRTLANRFLFDFHDQIVSLPGSTAAREMVVNTARTYLDRLSSEAASDRSLQVDLAAAYERLGDALGDAYGPNLGRGKEAKDAYERAYELRRGLGESSVHDADAMTLSILKRSDGELTAGSLKRSLELADEGLARARTNGTPRLIHAALLRRAMALMTLERTRDAKAPFTEASRLAREHSPRWTGGRGILMDTLARAARMEKLLGDYDGALATLREALAAAEETVKGAPTDVRTLGVILRIENEMGDIEGSPFAERGEFLAESVKCFQRALEVARRVRELDPLSFSAVYNELFMEFQVAEGTARLGDVRGLDLLDAASRHSDEVAARFPKQQALGTFRALAYQAIGWRASDFGQWQRAMRALDHTADLVRELMAGGAKRFPPSNMVLLRAQRGRAAAKLGLREKAIADLAACRELAGTLPGQSGLEFRNQGWCFHYSGEAELAFGSRARAVEYFEEALRTWDRAIAKPVAGKFIPRQREITRAALAALR